MLIELPDGQSVSIAHLTPHDIQCPCEQIGRDLIIKVSYANHCYTEKFDPEKHNREEILLYDAQDRPRCFCPVRYNLSLGLPAIVASLPTQRVNQTTQVRNYVFVTRLTISNQIYEVYFMLQRAQPDDRADLKLVIESAYPDIAPPVLPKRPRNIRFHVLARKVLLREPIRFAPR